MKQPLSYIHPDAKIAKNVVIEPFTSIDADVTIGEGSWIGSNVSIMDGARPLERVAGLDQMSQ